MATAAPAATISPQQFHAAVQASHMGQRGAAGAEWRGQQPGGQRVGRHHHEQRGRRRLAWFRPARRPPNTMPNSHQPTSRRSALSNDLGADARALRPGSARHRRRSARHGIAAFTGYRHAVSTTLWRRPHHLVQRLRIVTARSAPRCRRPGGAPAGQGRTVGGLGHPARHLEQQLQPVAPLGQIDDQDTFVAIASAGAVAFHARIGTTLPTTGGFDVSSSAARVIASV